VAKQQPRLTIYDPALIEALGENDRDRELPVIARLAEERPLPDGTRLVTRFGDIATLRVRPSRIASLAESDAVLAIEAARRLRLSDVCDDGPGAIGREAAASGAAYTRRPPGVVGDGAGVAAAALDFGCDFAHPAFRNADGSARLLALWDQRGDAGKGPGNRWGYGRIFPAAEINRALAADDPYTALGYDPADADAFDEATGEYKGAHGTHVLDIFAGNGRGGGMAGVAPAADLLFVHLSRTARVLGRENLGDSATVLEAVDFVLETAAPRACCINASIGAHGGPHDGSTLVEQGLDAAISMAPGRALVSSSGNYAAAEAHSEGRLEPGEQRTLRVRVPAGDPTDSEIELWFSGDKRIQVTVVDPDDVVLAQVRPGQNRVLRRDDDVEGQLYYQTSPQNGDGHFDLFLRPGALPGIWQLRLHNAGDGASTFHAWIERDHGLRPRFVAADVVRRSTTGTLTNGRCSISVGASDPYGEPGSLGHFSSFGPTRDGRMKPEIVAPGVHICAARSAPPEAVPGPRYTRKSGTSMAAPHCAGAVALMFAAASRPLAIAETRRLLFATADKGVLADRPPGGDERHRYGHGALDIVAAEQAARQLTVPAVANEEIMEMKRESHDESIVGQVARDVMVRALTTPQRDQSPLQLHERAVAATGGGVLESVTGPAEPFARSARAGDLLVRSSPAEGLLHTAVILSERIEAASELAARGVPVEAGGRGGYVEVAETPYGGGPARVVGRRLTDVHGRMPRGQAVFRGAGLGGAMATVGAATMATPVVDVGTAARQSTGAADVLIEGDPAAEDLDDIAAFFREGVGQLADGFENLLAQGPGKLVALLPDPGQSDAFAATARALLDEAGRRVEGRVSTAWSDALGRADDGISPGTGTLGSVLTVLLSNLDGPAFFDSLGPEGLFKDLVRPLSQLQATLDPVKLGQRLRSAVPFDRLQRLIVELVRYARGDKAAEETLLRMVDEHPYLAPFMLGGVAATMLLDVRLPWFEYLGLDLSLEAGDPGAKRKVKILPSPDADSGTKYLIVSDVHRDADTDKTGFKTGPIDHFSKNAVLFRKVIDYATDQGHMLIENGDVEEFWAIPNLAQSPDARMRDVIKTYGDIYRKLDDLHKRGRYFRTQGNHDSPLRDPSALAELNKAFTGTITNWDFLIIPGVKTMDEFTFMELFRGKRKAADYVGLDPNKYSRKKCLVVCHGHQFDFWNCEQNELFGRIVTALGRYPDGVMDDFQARGGVHMQGNPLFDFDGFFGHDLNYLFNHWLGPQPSQQKAHYVQHLANSDRQLRDTFMFNETLAASLVTFAMPLSKCRGSGRSNLGHQLLIGHTHYPQSQPFYPLGRYLLRSAGVRAAFDKAFGAVARALGGALSSAGAIGTMLSDRLNQFSGAEIARRWLDSTFKTRFFNSGVSGWHESVVYAIEITSAGQGRLLYFTSGCEQPQVMDWELTPSGPAAVAGGEALTAELMSRRAQLGEALDDVHQQIESTLGDLPEMAATPSGERLDKLFGIFRDGTESMLEFVEGTLPESIAPVVGGTGGAVAVADLSADAGSLTLQLGLTEFMTRLARVVRQGPGVGATMPGFDIEADLNAQQVRRLDEVRGQLEAAGLLPADRRDAGDHLALAWLFAKEHAPHVGNAHEGPAACPPDLGGFEVAKPYLLDERGKSLRALGSLLACLPVRQPVGPPEAGLVLRTKIGRSGSRLKVEVRLERADDNAQLVS